MAIGVWGRVAGAAVVGAMLSFGMALPAMAATKVTVNGEIITDTQIAQRVKLFALEGNKTGSRGAMQQLVDEALQLQEAKRLGINVSNAQVDSALQQVARNIKVSQDKLVQMLQAQGISVDSLRGRLKASIAWNGVTESAIAPQVQASDVELDQEAKAKLTAYNGFDYILKEIIFVAPGGQGASGRTAQANKYRQQFNGCAGAVDLSVQYNDVAVLDVGRRHATQMPEAIAKELANLNVGGITKPRVVGTGVSMLAICEKATAEDLTFIKDDLRANSGEGAMAAQVTKYMDDLRARSKIIYN